MTPVGTIMLSALGGAMYGAIGAGIGQDARHPILKGAIITGLIGGSLSAVAIAVSSSDQKQIGTSGLSNPRFP